MKLGSILVKNNFNDFGKGKYFNGSALSYFRLHLTSHNETRYTYDSIGEYCMILTFDNSHMQFHIKTIYELQGCSILDIIPKIY